MIEKGLALALYVRSVSQKRQSYRYLPKASGASRNCVLKFSGTLFEGKQPDHLDLLVDLLVSRERTYLIQQSIHHLASGACMPELSSKIYIRQTKNFTEQENKVPGLGPLVRRTAAFIEELGNPRSAGHIPFVSDLLDGASSAQLNNWANSVREGFTKLVVLGTGGSSLGGRALCEFGKSASLSNSGLEVLFFDNLSPHHMGQLLEKNSLPTTHFLVISKSGNTAETLAQAIVCISEVENKFGRSKVGNHFTVIVSKGNSPLAQIAQDHNLLVFDHPPNLSGRFSVLSVVGMAPAIAAGVDGEKVISGAQKAIQQVLDDSIKAEHKAPVLGACMQAILCEKESISQSILMPYDSRMVDFTRWFQQLWAESLGKNRKGTTPIGALGPVDQHSQLQLYLEGPRDKFFTLLFADTKGLGPRIGPEFCEKVGINYMSGRTIGDLTHAEARATLKTLVDHDLPVRVIECCKFDEWTLGYLFASFMIETVIMARLLEVEPFTQPAVEESKTLTKLYLERMY